MVAEGPRAQFLAVRSDTNSWPFLGLGFPTCRRWEVQGASEWRQKGRRLFVPVFGGLWESPYPNLSSIPVDSRPSLAAGESILIRLFNLKVVSSCVSPPVRQASQGPAARKGEVGARAGPDTCLAKPRCRGAVGLRSTRRASLFATDPDLQQTLLLPSKPSGQQALGTQRV